MVRKLAILIAVIFPLILLMLSGANGKKIKGTVFLDNSLFQKEEGVPHCAIDSGDGMVLELTQLYRNDLFMSEDKNTLRLRIHFADRPEMGKRISLPMHGVTVCYREEGKLLMFETFNGLGTIQFDALSEKKASGKIDLKLVKPHHNMSNSDYHYMGGAWKASVTH